jgi:hypothetical protein
MRGPSCAQCGPLLADWAWEGKVLYLLMSALLRGYRNHSHSCAQLKWHCFVVADDATTTATCNVKRQTTEQWKILWQEEQQPQVMPCSLPPLVWQDQQPVQHEQQLQARLPQLMPCSLPPLHWQEPATAVAPVVAVAAGAAAAAAGVPELQTAAAESHAARLHSSINKWQQRLGRGSSSTAAVG